MGFFTLRDALASANTTEAAVNDGLPRLRTGWGNEFGPARLCVGNRGIIVKTARGAIRSANEFAIDNPGFSKLEIRNKLRALFEAAHSESACTA